MLISEMAHLTFAIVLSIGVVSAEEGGELALVAHPLNRRVGKKHVWRV